MFHGFSATVVVEDSEGNEIDRIAISDQTIVDRDGQIMLAYFTPFRTGDYTATVNIESGVPALTDRQQTIYAQYQLCGLEEFPAFVAGAFALGAGIVALISAACVVPGLLRAGIRREEPAKDG